MVVTQAIARTHVNLIDLVDARGKEGRVKRFRSQAELSVYTHTTDKFFPKEDAKAGGLLRKLLRQIGVPYRSG